MNSISFSHIRQTLYDTFTSELPAHDTSSLIHTRYSTTHFTSAPFSPFPFLCISKSTGEVQNPKGHCSFAPHDTSMYHFNSAPPCPPPPQSPPSPPCLHLVAEAYKMNPIHHIVRVHVMHAAIFPRLGDIHQQIFYLFFSIPRICIYLIVLAPQSECSVSRRVTLQGMQAQGFK